MDLKKYNYDITLCTNTACDCASECARHISHFKGKHLVAQSMSNFEGCESSKEYLYKGDISHDEW